MEFKHYSVMLNETIEQLNIRPDGIYVDGTLGGAGHSSEIAKRLTTGRLIGIDQDADAIAAASERLKDYKDKVTIVRSKYSIIWALRKSMEFCSTLACHRFSLIHRRGDLPTGARTHLLICAWMTDRN